MTDPTTFDQKHELVTSYLFKPIVLAGLRLLFAVFTLATILATLIWQGVHGGAESCVPTLLCALQLMLIYPKVLLVLHQPDVYRHLRVHVCIRCANIRFRSVAEEG